MSILAPPPVRPHAGMGDDDRLSRLRLRLVQTGATMVTIVATGWFCTLGPIPAIISLMTAKHVLVAILMMGLGVDQPRAK
jgi:hypothetical protein